MNFLFHLYLSDHSTEGLVGSLMGDYVKGRIPEALPAVVRLEIKRHRAIDRFAHDHLLFQRSKRRMSTEFGLYKGIAVDLFYDHFLSRDWDKYAEVPLEVFADRVYRALNGLEDIIPEGMKGMAARMVEHQWLTSYRDADTIGYALKRMGDRLSRPNPLHLAGAELLAHYNGFAEDFAAFLPEAQRCAQRVVL